MAAYQSCGVKRVLKTNVEKRIKFNMLDDQYAKVLCSAVNVLIWTSENKEMLVDGAQTADTRRPHIRCESTSLSGSLANIPSNIVQTAVKEVAMW